MLGVLRSECLVGATERDLLTALLLNAVAPYQMCRWLRERGLSFARKQVEGHSALHKAAMRGQEGVLRWMLESDGAVPESEAAGLRTSNSKDVAATAPALIDSSADARETDESVRRHVPMPIGNLSTDTHQAMH